MRAAGFDYPIRYVAWRGPSYVDQDEVLQHVLVNSDRVVLQAAPVEMQRNNSPWLTAPTSALNGIRKVVGKSRYAAHEGVNTGGLNGCYWIRILKKQQNGDLLVENLYDVGKIRLAPFQATIEPDLVYPLLRGREVERWRTDSSSFIVAPQDPIKQREGIPEIEMRRRHPKTYAYLKKFEKELASRRDRKYYPEGSPFYTMRNMAGYSLALWKVVWPEVGHTVRAGVCGPKQVGSRKPVLPDHTIVGVSCETKEEAHFICALVNSSPAQCAASSYIVLHPSPHIMEHVAIPAFDRKDATHSHLSELSEKCHSAAVREDVKAVAALEAEIDNAAASLWGITDGELKAIQVALAETFKPKRVAKEDEED